jgi:hypothetical protein
MYEMVNKKTITDDASWNNVFYTFTQKDFACKSVSYYVFFIMDIIKNFAVVNLTYITKNFGNKM